MEAEYNIKLSSLDGDGAWYWNGSNFETVDYLPSKIGDANPFNYSYKSSELKEELIKAKNYADKMYNEGKWILSSKNVYSQRIEY